MRLSTEKLLHLHFFCHNHIQVLMALCIADGTD